MNQIKIGRYERELPSNWGEVTDSQMLSIYKAKAITAAAKWNELNVMRMIALKALLDLPGKIWAKISMSDLIRLTSLLDWMFEVVENEETGEITYHFVNKRDKPYSLERMGLFAPSERLGNCTLYEFTQADINFTMGHGIVMAAILYRPSKPHTQENIERKFVGDIRQPYDGYEATVSDRRKLISALDECEQKIIWDWYQWSRHKWICGVVNEDGATGYPNVFKSSGESGEGDPLAIHDMMVSLAGGKFGDFNSTKNTNLHVIMRFCHLEIQRAKELEMKMGK